MRIPFRFLVGAFAVWCAACSGSASDTPDAPAAVTDISGWYDVSNALAGPCGAPSADPLAPTLIRVERLQDTFYVRACTAMNDSACSGSLFPDLNVPTNGGMTGEGGSAFFSAGCSLSYERVTATTATNGLAIISTTISVLGDTTIAQAACNLAAAKQLAAPCTRERRLSLQRRP